MHTLKDIIPARPRPPSRFSRWQNSQELHIYAVKKFETLTYVATWLCTVHSSLDHAEAVQYAGLISILCQKSRSAVRELDPSNDVTFLRLRSHKHEILVAPGCTLPPPASVTIHHGLVVPSVLGIFCLPLALLSPKLCVKPTELLKMSDKEYILMVIQAPQVKPSMKKEDAKA